MDDESQGGTRGVSRAGPTDKIPEATGNAALGKIVSVRDLVLLHAKTAVLEVELEKVNGRLGKCELEEGGDFERARSLAHQIRNYRLILNLAGEAMGFKLGLPGELGGKTDR